MGSIGGPKDLASLYAARSKVNNDRVPTLFDIDRVRSELLEMHEDPRRSNIHAMQKKYPYLFKSTPTLSRLLAEDPDFKLDQVFRLFTDIQKSARKEISQETVGENIVRSLMP